MKCYREMRCGTMLSPEERVGVDVTCPEPKANLFDKCDCAVRCSGEMLEGSNDPAF